MGSAAPGGTQSHSVQGRMGDQLHPAPHKGMNLTGKHVGPTLCSVVQCSAVLCSAV